LARALALRLGFVAKPKEDRWHQRATALLGGPAIVIGTLLPAVLILGRPPSRVWLFCGIGALATAAVGLVDEQEVLDMIHNRLAGTCAGYATPLVRDREG